MAESSFVTRSIELQALTWLRDSNGLFDYEDPYLVRQSFTLTSTARVLRISDLCIVREEHGGRVEDATELGIVSLGYEGYGAGFISVAEDCCAWQVVRAMTHCTISEGDVYRIGRATVEVLQVSVFGYEEPKLGNKAQAVVTLQRNTQGQSPCRICLSDQQTKQDPLLSPCLCSGTMGVIHLNCLKEWLRSKVSSSSSGKSTTYSWTPPECELCKSELPLRVSIDGQEVSLMDVKQPMSPFVVIRVENDETQASTVHVVSMNDGDVARIVLDK